MQPDQTYVTDYPGYWNMKFHDSEQNELKRWFDNYKIDRYAAFQTDYEWLVVKEIETAVRGKKIRYVVEIGADHHDKRREVVMDHQAPKPPVMTFAAKRKYVPSPPKSAYDIMMEEVRWRKEMLYFEQMRRYAPVFSAPQDSPPPSPPRYRRNV